MMSWIFTIPSVPLTVTRRYGFLNDSTVKAIRKLKDGNGNYIWQPSVREGEPDKILNRPYRTSIYVPELAAGNRVMAFGDYSYYWIADRQGRSFKRLNELYATTGQVGFLCVRACGRQADPFRGSQDT